MKKGLFAFTLAALAHFAGAAVSPGPMTLAYEYDITREKVPTAETMRRVADIVSSLGYTQLQLYFKDNFAYPGHEIVWKNRGHITPEEVKDFNGYCRSKNLELVPYQSGFGHLEPWMKFERYRKLGEHDGRYFCTALGREMNGAALCPTDPASLNFLNGLFDDLLPCFSSKFVNLGCDEVWDIHAETGRSAEEIRKKGSGRVYLEFLVKLNGLVKSRGRTMMFWSDIIRNHPDLVRQLPPDMIALDWNYEGSAPYHLTTAALKHAPCRYYVCPGTSSWCSFFGRHHNMRANVTCAWHWGRRNGAAGLLLTDWGDNGHPQPWIVSLPSIVYTAMLVKNNKAPSDEEVAAKVDEICSCRIGASLIRAGNAYLRATDPHMENGTMLYRISTQTKSFRMPKHLTKADFASALAELRAAAGMRDLTGAPDWVRDDAELIDLLTELVARRVDGEKRSLVEDYRGRYTRLWNRQNRPLGVEDSLKKVFGGEGE